jgi:cysteine-rich repeat protein
MSRNGVIVLPLCVLMGAATVWAQGKAYWTDGQLDNVQSVNLQTMGSQVLVPGGDFPRGIDLNLPGGKIYWVDAGLDAVRRANLNGSGAESIVPNLDNPYDIVLDLPGGKMYWSDQGDAPKIQRANLDGTGLQTVVTLETAKDKPAGIALCGTFVYWIDAGTPNRLMRAPKTGGVGEERLSDIGLSPDYLEIDCPGNKVYWTDRTAGTINTIGLNTTDTAQSQVLFNTTSPRGLWIDPQGPFPGQVYWITPTAIRVGNINGTGTASTVYSIPQGGGPEPEGLTLDTGCGNGVVTAGIEQCDDGNIVSLDGCSGTCQDEPLIFVDGSAPGPTHDGSTWCSAYTTVYAGLTAAASQPGFTLVVAAGTYLPSTSGLGNPRDATFTVPSGVMVVGGYGGCGHPAPSVRDPVANPTILSGDLNGNDPVTTDNVYHVVTISNTSATTLVDGFVIRDGNANGAGNKSDGAGIFNSAGDAKIRNCTVTDNHAADDGGGMINTAAGADPVISRSIFQGNTAVGEGGGLYNENGNPKLANCEFRSNTGSGGGAISTIAGTFVMQNAVLAQNSAQAGGGGGVLAQAAVTLVNASFNANTTTGSGGALRIAGAGSATVRNSILWGDTPTEISGTATVTFSDVQGGAAGAGNINVNPQYIAAPTNLRIPAGSPCVNTGSNANLQPDFADLDGDNNVAENTPLDLRNVVRIVNTTVDMGGYEVGCASVADCADLNMNGIRDNLCVFWACNAGACQSTNIDFADMGGASGACPPDGTADANDRFHALNCFSDTSTLGPPNPYPCEVNPPQAYNVDAGGPFGGCSPDGVCDGNDAFHATHAFDCSTLCSCPGDPCGPAPDMPNVPMVLGRSTVSLQADRQRVAAGELIDVHVLLDSPQKDLRGYQLHLQARGGRSGSLELVDISIQDDDDHVFSGLAFWQAFNVLNGQMVVGMDAPGVATAAEGYLATFTFRASPDAAGRFVIELLHDDTDPAERTYFFATPANGKIEIQDAGAAVVAVGPAAKRDTRR